MDDWWICNSSVHCINIVSQDFTHFHLIFFTSIIYISSALKMSTVSSKSESVSGSISGLSFVPSAIFFSPSSGFFSGAGTKLLVRFGAKVSSSTPNGE